MRITTAVVFAMISLPIFGGDVSASIVNYHANVNLKDSESVQINIDGVQVFLPGINFPGAYSIVLNPGDVLNGTVSFGRDRLLISDIGRGSFEVLTFFPFITSDLSDTVSSGSITLTGVRGEYLAPQTVLGNIDGAVLGGYRIGDLTSSSFSFSGIDFTINYEHGTTSRFDPYVVSQFSRVGGRVLENTVVPEPGTWSLMLTGLGILGVNLRRAKAFNQLKSA